MMFTKKELIILMLVTWSDCMELMSAVAELLNEIISPDPPSLCSVLSLTYDFLRLLKCIISVVPVLVKSFQKNVSDK